MANGFPEDFFDMKDLIKDLQEKSPTASHMLELQMLESQMKMQNEAQKQMAMSRIDPQMREHMVHIIRREYPDIYEYVPCHSEFDHRFEELINQGCPVEEAVYRAAQRMMQGHPDLQRMGIARKHTAGRSYANPYRGSITDHGMSRSQREREARNARDEDRIRQMQMGRVAARQMNHHALDAYSMGLIPKGIKPKKKKLTILEQLQADVDIWLKDSLKLTHLEGIKL